MMRQFWAVHELSDGTELKLTYTISHDASTFNDPEEWGDRNDRFQLDGDEVDREDLPAEVTDELIDLMAGDANEERFDGNDP